MDLANMSINSIPQYSTASTNLNLQTDVSAAVLSKSLDLIEVSGQALIDMMRRSMEISVNPNVGANFDVMI